MKKIQITILLIFLYQFVHASPQVPDYLIHNGDTISIYSNPLEAYLESKGLKDIDRGCNSSPCWRGYIGIWEIKQNKLFLVDIKKCGLLSSAGVYSGIECDSTEVSDFFDFVSTEFSQKPKLADWFSGELLSPEGRLIEYIHMGYLSKFERERKFTFKNGNLIGIKTDYNEVKPELYDKYNNSLIRDTLFHYISKLDWVYLEEELLCADYYVISINRKGRVSNIKFEPLGDSKWEDFWYNFNDSGCRRRIKKSIKDIRFNKYLKGNPKKRTIKIGLKYSEGKVRLL